MLISSQGNAGTNAKRDTALLSLMNAFR